MLHRISRRFLVSSTAAASLSTSALAHAQSATPDTHDDHDHDHHHDESACGDVYILVGDTEAATLSAYAAADGDLMGTIPDVAMNGHAGIINLPDGTALVVDDLAGRLLQIGVHEGEFEVLGEAPVPGPVAHIAIESDHAHLCAVGTTGEDEYQLHLVDLSDFSVMNLHLPDAGELFLLTDDGIDAVYWENNELEYGQTLAWPSSRGYFARLIGDGSYLFTYTSDRTAPETAWDTWKNNVVLYDVATGEPIVTPLPDGYTFRYSLGEQVAVFYVIGADGDVLITIDVDPQSDTFGDIVTTTPLPAMTAGAQLGEAFYEVGAYRATAILPDDSRAYITRGGDGIVEIIDPLHGEVLTSVEHTTPLAGGGTLAVFGPGVPVSDTIGR